MCDLPGIIPKKEDFLALSNEEKRTKLQLRKIKKTMFLGNDYVIFTRPITDLAILILESKGYNVKMEEIQVPEKYLARHGFERTRMLTRYRIYVS